MRSVLLPLLLFSFDVNLVCSIYAVIRELYTCDYSDEEIYIQKSYIDISRIRKNGINLLYHLIQFFCCKSGFGDNRFLLIFGEAVILRLSIADAYHIADFIPVVIGVEAVGAFA